MEIKGVEIKLDQAFEAISKIKIPYLTIFLAFISSYVLWFLSIYFFKPDFIVKHGLVITLVSTYALTTPWILISMLYVPKEMTWYVVKQKAKFPDSFNFLITERSIVNLYIFANAILIHGFIIYVSYIFHLSFFTIVSIVFWMAIIGYFIIDISLRRDFERQNNTA